LDLCSWLALLDRQKQALTVSLAECPIAGQFFQANEKEVEHESVLDSELPGGNHGSN
jgi:hypothetical protein